MAEASSMATTPITEISEAKTNDSHEEDSTTTVAEGMVKMDNMT